MPILLLFRALVACSRDPGLDLWDTYRLALALWWGRTIEVWRHRKRLAVALWAGWHCFALLAWSLPQDWPLRSFLVPHIQQYLNVAGGTNWWLYFSPDPGKQDEYFYVERVPLRGDDALVWSNPPPYDHDFFGRWWVTHRFSRMVDDGNNFAPLYWEVCRYAWTLDKRPRNVYSYELWERSRSVDNAGREQSLPMFHKTKLWTWYPPGSPRYKTG